MNFAGPIDTQLLNDSPVSLDGEGFAFGAKPGFVQYHASGTHVVVPDAHLLFSGNYVRIGSDLIISNADQKFVVGNYFKGETRPALTSSDGATLSGQIVDALTGHVHYAQAGAPAAAQVIGHVLKMSGGATAIRNGVSVELHIGDAVQKGDVVQTGSDSSIGMTFVDGSAFGMTSNARMVLNEMIYDPNGSSNSSLISLVQGTITFVAGQTAKNGNMRVETPVATMGIRGTAVLVEIAANDGPTKFSVLLEPDGHTGSFNLYDKTTGQLIGTVSQAGQVTLVSSLGIGQPPTAVEQLKTLADQEAAKTIVNQVFQLYFPNFNPDNSNPKTQKFGSSSTNNLAETNFGQMLFAQLLKPPPAPQPIYLIDPVTGNTIYNGKVFYNTKAQFWADKVTAEQAFVPSPDSFKISDVVHINDPDVGNAPFYDIATPFVPGSAIIKSAVSTNPNLSASFLSQFLHIDQTTGVVSFDRLAFNFLGQGESVTFMLQVTSRSGPDEATVLIPIVITGDNDVPNGAPTIVLPASDIVGAVKEDTHVTAGNTISSNGSITFQDVDLSDTHVASTAFTSSSSTLPGFATGQHLGMFTIDPVSEDSTDTINTGTMGWHFSLPDNDPVLQSLAEGQTITQVYTITIKDIHGAFVTQTITITITGTNDAPVLTADASVHQADEVPDTTGAPNSVVDVATGTLAFIDVDLSDTHTASAALHPGSTSVVWSGGGYNDIPQATRDALNDAVTASVSENNTDPSNQGSVGWEFKLPDHLFDFLAHGETLTLIYDVTVTDNNGLSSTKQVTVQIAAANDQPVITAIDAKADVKEDVDPVGSVLKDNGTVTFTDTDLTDTHTAHVAYNNDAAGSAGVSPALAAALATALTVPASTLVAGDHDFNWDFALDTSLIQYLAEGETITATYNITVEDNSNGTNDTSLTQKVTVTITGTNDAPVITSSPSTATITVPELVATTGSTALHQVGGIVTFDDVDLTDTHQITQSAAIFAWTGGTLTPTQLSDLAAASVRTLTPHDSTGTGGGSIDWLYKITDGALDFLAFGQTLTVTYDITVQDYHNGVATGTSAVQTITITYTGANDAPVVSGAVSDALVVEDGPGSVLNALANASDADDGATLSVVNVPGTLPAGVTYDAIHHTFTLDPSNAAYQHLADGVSTTVTVNYGVSDGIVTTPTPASVSWTITGTNDAPVVSGAVSDALVVEDGPGSVLNALANASDADDGATLSVINVPGVDAPGSLPPGVSYDPGTHTFTLDPGNAAYQDLAEGAPTTVTVSYDVSDGITTTPASVSWTITGANDAPAIVAASTTATGAITKITNTTGSPATDSVSGTIAFTDPDSADTHTATAGSPTFTWSGGVLTAAQIAALAAAGSFVPNVTEAGGTGSVAWTYNITDSALDFMLPWQTLTVQYGVTVADNHGVSFVEPVTVTVSATYQSSTLPSGHDDSATVSVNAPAIIPVLNNDTGNGLYIYETLAYPYSSFVVTNHSNAGATVTSLGNAVFYDPTTSSLFNSLTYGQSATDHFAYGIADGPGNVSWANVTVTVTGADHTSLATSADTISNVHTTVVSADATTLNPLDSLTGSGSDTLLLNGSGTFDLAHVAHFSGFQDIVVHGSNASLDIDSSDTAGVGYIIGSGSNLTLTTADASLDLSHTTVSGLSITGTNAGGTTFVVGDSGTANAITGATGPLTIQVAADAPAGLTLNAPVAGTTLIGGNGNDTLVSAQTDVTMTGGAGADNFKFNANFGNDTVTDFHAGQDAVYFQSSLFTDIADIFVHAQATGVGGADTLITSHDGGSTLTLKGVTLAQLHASDFHLT